MTVKKRKPLTVKEEEARLNIRKLQYSMLLNSWDELNRKYRTLLHVNGLVLSAIVICIGFIIDSTNGLSNPSIPYSINTVLLVFLISLFLSLSFIVLSLAKLVSFRVEKLNFKISMQDSSMFPKTDWNASSLTFEYETIHEEIDSEWDKLDKRVWGSVKFLVFSVVLLFASLVSIIVSELSILKTPPSTECMIIEMSSLLVKLCPLI